jgi:hypothetical protein
MLHAPYAESPDRYPYMLPFQARGAAAAVAPYDLIQAYETLTRLDAASALDVDAL